MTNIIVYHKNCMDGVSAAYIAYKALKTQYPDRFIATLPLHYGEESKLFNMIGNYDGNVNITMVDFSFKHLEMSQLLSSGISVTVVDHHATAWDELSPLVNEPNFTLHFDNNKSGATLALEVFKDHHELRPGLFNYIEDRDLWKWEKAHSKEISEYLAFSVDTDNLPSFEEAYEAFNKDSHQFIQNGKLLLAKKEQSVETKKTQAQEVFIKGTPMMLINATENVSELGNAIAEHFDKPACMFFFIEDFKVVLSFRSMDHLPSVSDIAKQFPGGGGHRNAAGCTVDINELMLILETK